LNIRTLICTLAGVLAVILLLVLTPHHSFTPKGIALPAKTVRSPISPDQVTIYQEAPTDAFTRLGQVRVELGFEQLGKETKIDLFQKVRALAASLGANGVVLQLLVPNDGVRHTVTFIGMAIYMPQKSTRGAL